VKEKSRILKKANDDQSRPVAFNDSFGGADNQLRSLLKYLPDENFKDINLILNNANHDLIEKDKINVLCSGRHTEAHKLRLTHTLRETHIHLETYTSGRDTHTH